jgi:hypothetical protein
MLSDAVSAIVLALHSAPVGEIYNIVDSEPVTVHEFVAELARAFGTPKPHSMPYSLGKLLMPFGAHFLDRTVLRATNEKARVRRRLQGGLMPTAIDRDEVQRLLAEENGQLVEVVPEGLQNARSCRCAAVFADESAESVAALDLSVAGWRVRICPVGREEREPAVRAPPVVMIGVDA